MIVKVLLSLLIGVLAGGFVYVVLGLLRRDDSDGRADRLNPGGKKGAGQKKETKKRPSDDDEDSTGGRTPGPGLAPSKEWYGGFRG